MSKIPKWLLNEILKDDYYKKCSRNKEGSCRGRVTFEHAIIFAGKQLNEKWAIIPLCEYHHAVNSYQDAGDLNKELNVCIALNRATDAELKSKSKVINYLELRRHLNSKYDIR